MKQSPETESLHSIQVPLIEPQLYQSTPKKILAAYHAFAPKAGDFSNNYFNYLTIFEITKLLIAPLQDSESYPEILTACYVMAIYFAFNSLTNDFFLYNLAEESQNFYESLMENSTTSLKLDRMLGYISYIPPYLAFGITSANGTVGVLNAFGRSIPGRIIGSIAAILTTELGIVYSHIIFTPLIKKFMNFLKKWLGNCGATLQDIFNNPIISLQIIKLFAILSAYYTSMGIFYLYSLAEELSANFAFSIDDFPLNTAMIIAGILVFLTNTASRFLSVFEKYSAPLTSSSEIKIEILQEILISGAGLTLSSRRLPSTSGILGIISSIISLGIGLRSIQIRSGLLAESSPASSYSFLTHWLNGHSRFIKSTFLPFAAISKILQMLKTHSQIDYGFGSLDIFCMMMIIGIPIGVNNSKIYKRSIDSHIRYLQEKWRIEKEHSGLFGLCCLFTPRAAYPPEYKERLTHHSNSR